MKIVIRAGGVGTRLWPLSRKNNPKQFQAIASDKVLIRDTQDRIAPLVNIGDDLFISVNESVKHLVKKYLPEVSDKNIIPEPASKNTGPAICLESVLIADRFSDHEIVASLPSDDYITDPEAFRTLLQTAETFLKKNPEYIMTPGIKPNYPDTGYSYIKSGDVLQEEGEEGIFKVADWVEKPDLDYCKELIASGRYFYHTGMYIWQLKTVINLFEKYQPEMLAACREIVELMKLGGQEEKIAKIYSSLEKMSIETAITDKAEKIAMCVSNRIGWSDLGKWHTIKDLLPANQGDNLIKGNVIPLDTTDCMIYGNKDKVIATIGLDDMVIIDTDDALLVCPRERSDEAKKIVEELQKNKNSEKYL
jgi:mannose-1-phosphate guanylyltransferase